VDVFVWGDAYNITILIHIVPQIRHGFVPKPTAVL